MKKHVLLLLSVGCIFAAANVPDAQTKHVYHLAGSGLAFVAGFVYCYDTERS